VVERLRTAIEKARRQRQERQPPDGAPARGAEVRLLPAADAAWSALTEAAPDERTLEAERVVSYRKTDPAHVAFDVLRTRLLKTCRDHGWTRIAVTSPTKACGKSMVCANLAFSLARNEDTRIILVDLDLKLPRLAQVFGLAPSGRVSGFLQGLTPPEGFLIRIGPNLAVGLNAERVKDSAELIQSPQAAAALGAMIDRYRPGIVIYDLPPLLVSDDVIGLLPQVDAVLLVIAAGQSTAKDVGACETLLSDATNFIGVILNKCSDDPRDTYSYEYQYG
jgi:Mrp family chromosome partitioning ATPase